MKNTKSRYKAERSFSRNKDARGEPSHKETSRKDGHPGGKSASRPGEKAKGKFSPRPRAPIGKPRREHDAGGKGGKARPERDSDSKPGKSLGIRPRGFAGKTRPEFARTNNKPTHKPKDLPRGEDVRQGRDTVLIWGLHAARAAWLNPKRKIHRIWLTEGGQKIFEETQKQAHGELLKRPDAKMQDRSELDRITPPGSVHQGIVIEASPVPEPLLHDIITADVPPDLILVLDQVTDPHNVGAILRSAAAFGAGAVIMTERNAPTTTGVLAKSASGALEHVPMIHVVNLARALEDLRNAGYWSVGLAEEGEKDLGQMDMSGRTALVLGNEGEGLRHLTRQKCDELARLPTGGEIGSLNVSNAAAVALYEVRRQAKAK